MERCIRTGYHWGGHSFLDNEERIVLEMMGKWNSCRTFQDILQVNVRGVSVFYYNATLATWFYGIDVVRFINTPHAGRCLEII